MPLPLPKPTMPKCPKLETNLLQTARLQAVDLDSEDSSRNHHRGDTRVLVAPFPKATFTKIEPSFRVMPKGYAESYERARACTASSRLYSHIADYAASLPKPSLLQIVSSNSLVLSVGTQKLQPSSQDFCGTAGS